MSELVNHIGLIQTKLQHLLKQYEHIQKENNLQLQLIDSLKKELLEQKDKMEGVNQQNLILKASLSTMNEADKKELEQKIQHYIKNIDKCISLMSQ